MNADVITENSRRANLFIRLSKFDMENFEVRVQHLQLAQNNASKTSSKIIRLERSETATPSRKGK
jgi:hypothetical protein